MDYRLERQCPFIHPETPSWHWCGRPCFCRPFIIDAAARAHALTPGVSRAPNYDFDIMPGDRQPGFKPHPGYGDFRKHKPQDPAQRAKADAVAATLPHTGFGLITHTAKPKPRPEPDVEDATVVTDNLPAVTDNTPDVTDKQSAAERQRAYRKRHAEELRDKERKRKAMARKSERLNGNA